MLLINLKQLTFTLIRLIKFEKKKVEKKGSEKGSDRLVFSTIVRIWQKEKSR